MIYCIAAARARNPGGRLSFPPRTRFSRKRDVAVGPPEQRKPHTAHAATAGRRFDSIPDSIQSTRRRAAYA